MALVTVPLQAQAPSAVTRVAETVLTADALAPTLAAFRAESLRVRPAPSAALDRTAQYLIAQLQQLGVQPGFQRWNPETKSMEGVWMLRYPVPGQRQLDYAGSHVLFDSPVAAGGQPILTEEGKSLNRSVSLSLARAAHVADEIAAPVLAERLPGGWGGIGEDGLGRVDVTSSKQAVLVAGPQSTASLAAATAAVGLTDHVVIYVPPASGDTADERRVIERLYAIARGVVIVRATDSVPFAAAVAAARRRPVQVVESYLRWATGPRRWPWAVEVRAQAVAGVLAAAGVDLLAVRVATAPVTRRLETLDIQFQATADTAAPASLVTAPIVAGLLPGTDSLLAQEELIVATYMDTPATPVPRGASDTVGANLAGLIALARAFSDSATRPQRSVLLVAMSGEAGTPVAWGSHFLAEAPLDMNQDLFGAANFFLGFDVAGGGDTVGIDGAGALELMPAPAWVAAEHPELGLTVVDSGTLAAPESSAGAFARALIPSLSVHRLGARLEPSRGSWPAGALSSASSAAATATARLLRYVFYLGHQMANAQRFPPSWSTEGRREFLQAQTP